MRGFSKVAKILALALFATTLTSGRTAHAAPDVQCIGDGISEYAKDVLDGLGNLSHVRLLTPVFDLSNPDNLTLYSIMQNSGVDMNRFYGVAVNAYHHSGLTIASQVNSISASNLIITETGWYPNYDGTDGALKSDLEATFNTGRVEAALLFNIFGNNPEFTRHTPSNPGAVIAAICPGGNCSLLGANSASYYVTPSLYNNAEAANMGYTLEIAKSSDLGSALAGITLAHTKGMIPIVRIGVGRDGGGFDGIGGPQALIDFINSIDSSASGTVYVIVGPNEPLLECWATPTCGGCGYTGTPGPRKIIGIVTTSKVEDINGVKKTNLNAEGVQVCAYQGKNDLNPAATGTLIKKFAGGDITDKNGYFEIDTVWGPESFFDVKKPPSNYLALYVGNDIVDLYRVDLTGTMETLDIEPEEYIKFNYRDRHDGGEIPIEITIPALKATVAANRTNAPQDFPKPAEGSNGKCPEEVTYMSRELSDVLRCGQTTSEQGDTNITQVSTPIEIGLPLDNRYKDSWLWGFEDVWSIIKSLFGFKDDSEEVHNKNLPNDKPEGWTAVLNTSKDVGGENRNVACMFYGCPEGYRAPPTGSATDQDNSEMYSCELLKESNGTLGSRMNSFLGRGWAIHTNPVAGPQSYPSIYKEVLLTGNGPGGILQSRVCNSSEFGDVKFYQIQPPKNWLDGEVCTPGDPGCQYLLDYSYFPYDMLRKVPSGRIVETYDEAMNDSYLTGEGVDPYLVRDAIYTSGDPLPWQQGDKGGRTLSNFVEVSGIEKGSFGPITATNAISTNIKDSPPPIYNIMPVNKVIAMPPATPTEEGPQYSLSGLNYVNTNSGSNSFAKIGLQRVLCGFSSIDGFDDTINNREVEEHSPFATQYDFRMDTIREQSDPNTFYERDHTTGSILTRLVVAIYQIAADTYDSWRDAADRTKCLPDNKEVLPSGTRCDLSKAYETGCECNLVDKDCTFNGIDCTTCSAYDDAGFPIQCTKKVEECKMWPDKYNCMGVVDNIPLVSEERVVYYDKNAEYTLDGFYSLLAPVGTKLLDMGAECSMDKYADKQVDPTIEVDDETDFSERYNPTTGEGFFEKCSKSSVSIDYIKMLVRPFESKYYSL